MDGRTDGQTDGGDCIMSRANAVGNRCTAEVVNTAFHMTRVAVLAAPYNE